MIRMIKYVDYYERLQVVKESVEKKRHLHLFSKSVI